MPHIYIKIEELVWNLSKWLALNIINKKKYKLETITMSHSLNQFLHEHLGPLPYIILIIHFWIKKNSCIVVELPQNITLYFNNVWKWEKYMIFNVSIFSIWDKKIKYTVLKLFNEDFTWVFHMRWLPKCKSKNYIVSVLTRILQCMLNLIDSRRL
jgi:hypothetical protein